MIERKQSSIIVDLRGQRAEVPVLVNLEFSSARKRSSVVARLPDGRLMLYVKGADDILCDPQRAAHDTSLVDTEYSLGDFGRQGLRTLCLACRELREDRFVEWKGRYDSAATLVTGREDAVAALQEELERGLTVFGGTAIEDRLQDGVQETIVGLIRAGLRVVVLTGDKVETAINGGHAAGLLHNEAALTIFDDPANIDDRLTDALAMPDEDQDRHSLIVTGECAMRLVE
jgi:phospholipid-translocating ATPase